MYFTNLLRKKIFIFTSLCKFYCFSATFIRSKLVRLWPFCMLCDVCMLGKLYYSPNVLSIMIIIIVFLSAVSHYRDVTEHFTRSFCSHERHQKQKVDILIDLFGELKNGIKVISFLLKLISKIDIRFNF